MKKDVFAHQADFIDVQRIAEQYCLGLYTANTELLRSLFDDNAHLQAPGVRRSLSQWLDLVASRDIPEQSNSADDFVIRQLAIFGQQAIVQLECPLFERRYLDHLTLLKEQGQWLIVNKTYADLT
ncbi:nuclear transport factor 2 family protein [Catenovulum sp. SM1970]|uniref:nuclear transport factor 2 family protein n=1 Tax=Marinifaba aquimaris TaxID=2741323 RepID=UPI001573BA33|nr:nuclear transport factor 2 family protein [Marinifaba aquimaris]NTS76286.1 nuclear transport factor 2 family protein [Marinifaba aquimaris]